MIYNVNDIHLNDRVRVIDKRFREKEFGTCTEINDSFVTIEYDDGEIGKFALDKFLFDVTMPKTVNEKKIEKNDEKPSKVEKSNKK